jgi:hypothetical protein
MIPTTNRIQAMSVAAPRQSGQAEQAGNDADDQKYCCPINHFAILQASLR